MIYGLPFLYCRSKYFVYFLQFFLRHIYSLSGLSDELFVFLFSIYCTIVSFWLMTSKPFITAVAYIGSSFHPFVTVSGNEFWAALVTHIAVAAPLITAGLTVTNINLFTVHFVCTVINGCTIKTGSNCQMVSDFSGDGSRILTQILCYLLKGHILIQTLLYVDAVGKCKMFVVAWNWFAHIKKPP